MIDSLAARTQLPDTFVLGGGCVVADVDFKLIEPGYVVVRGGRIAEVGEGDGPERVPRVDAGGRLIVPAFINGHTHIEDAVVKELAFGVASGVNLLFEPDGLRHVRMREMPDDELVAGMRRAARQMLASGTVAFADYRTRGAAGVELLRRACVGLPMRCLIFGGHSAFPVQDDVTLNANEAVLSDAQVADIADTIAVADGFAPVRANDTTDAALRQIAALVRGAGKRLSTHSAASPDYRRVSLARTGRSDIDRVIDHLAPDFVVHMTVATEHEIDQMVAADIPMVMCARAMASLGRPIPPYALALERGAVVGLGTDNVMMTSPDLLSEVDFLGRAVRLVARDPAAVDARSLLASLTTQAARALGIDDDLGSISVGKAASMVVFDRSSPNLAHSVDLIASLVGRATSADIEAVIVDGQLAHGQLRPPSPS